MTDVKLKCCSLGCFYVTEEVSAEIAWGCCSFTGRKIMLNKEMGAEKGTTLGQQPVASS